MFVVREDLAANLVDTLKRFKCDDPTASSVLGAKICSRKEPWDGYLTFHGGSRVFCPGMRVDIDMLMKFFHCAWIHHGNGVSCFDWSGLVTFPSLWEGPYARGDN